MQLEHVLQAALQCDPSLVQLRELRAFLGLATVAAGPQAAAMSGMPASQAVPVLAQVPPACAPAPAAYAQPVGACSRNGPIYAQPVVPAPVAYAQPIGPYPGTGVAYANPAPTYGLAAPVYEPQPMYSTPVQHHSHSSGHMAAAAVGGAAVGVIGGMMLESAIEGRHREHFIEERRDGFFGTDTVIEQSRSHGFFGSEQVVEEVRTDMFGDTEVRREVVDRNMFGQVTGVREEVVERDMFGNVTEYEVEDW